MGARFSGRLGTSNVRMRRERLLFVGGGTLMFALVVIGALLIYSNSVVQAGSTNDVVTIGVNDELALSTVVLIAPKTQIPKGTKITQAYLREVHWPRDQVPEGAVRYMHDVRNMYTLAALAPNQPILRTTIASNPPSFGIGELLPPGHRAVTIQVNAESGLEGWATPGAHVDVYLTYRDPKDGVQKTRVAVEDAVVLSSGGSAKKLNSQEVDRVQVLPTVTLAVTFEDSLKIQTARAVGRLTLALRNTNDLKSQGGKVFGESDWDGIKRKKADNKFAPPGYARIVDEDGNEKHFVLGQDKKWWVSEGDAE